MAEYSEVIKQFKRMCNNGHCATATGCPMYPSSNRGQCRRIAFERPSDFEKRVMEWAAEHPEPVYPTWYKYLENAGIVTKTKSEYSQIYDTVLPTSKMFDPIPADIAQKLGIEPKEG